MRLLYRTHGTTPDIDKVGSYSYKLLGLSERSAAEQGHFNMGAPSSHLPPSQPTPGKGVPSPPPFLNGAPLAGSLWLAGLVQLCPSAVQSSLRVTTASHGCAFFPWSAPKSSNPLQSQHDLEAKERDWEEMMLSFPCLGN